MIVVDSSALLDYLIASTATAERIRSVVTANTVAAPQGVDLECVSVLRGLVLGGKLDERGAAQAVDLLAAMRIRRYATTDMLWRIWELRHNTWPYDAAYLALAETLDVPLWTIDSKLGRVPGIRCRVLNARDSTT